VVLSRAVALDAKLVRRTVFSAFLEVCNLRRFVDSKGDRQHSYSLSSFTPFSAKWRGLWVYVQQNHSVNNSAHVQSCASKIKHLYGTGATSMMRPKRVRNNHMPVIGVHSSR
jgi:hypothetical protein